MDMSSLFKDRLKSYKPTRWDNIFFSEAVLWSRMSHDTQTQCGCILVKNKATIATGYNGFIRDINDSVFPKTRPEKYHFMIHSESNAVYNAAREGKSTMGSRAYITAPPCRLCLQTLWQCGVYEIYFTDISSPKNCFYGEEYHKILDEMQKSKPGLLDFRYFPHASLDAAYLKQSLEKFENPD